MKDERKSVDKFCWMGMFSNTQGADDVVGRVNFGSKCPSTSGSFLSRVHVRNLHPGANLHSVVQISTRGVFLAIWSAF